MTFADEQSWSNRDTDVTPLERRTWTSWTVLGYWMSDALSAQSWAGASAIIAVGLTWYVYVVLLQPARYSVTRTPVLTSELYTQERSCLLSYIGYVHGDHSIVLEWRSRCRTSRPVPRHCALWIWILFQSVCCGYPNGNRTLLARYVQSTWISMAFLAARV